jgi:hypothetical protein
MRNFVLGALGWSALALASPLLADEGFGVPIDASFIEAHTAEFTINYRDADGNLADGGKWTDEVVVDDDHLTRTVVRYTAEGVADLKRTIVADRTSLKPKILDQRFGPTLSGVMHVDFFEKRADQLLISSPTGNMRRIDAEFEHDVWELSLWGTLAMSFPFKTQTEFTLPTVSPDRQSARDVTFRIEGREYVEFDDERLETIKVSIPDENWTFWVRKQAPYILRIEHPAPGGLTAISTLSKVR